MQMVSVFVAAGIGGIAGAIAGLIGDGVLVGLLPGAFVGGVVGFLFTLRPRSIDDPSLAVESFSPAGFMGGITGSVIAEAGLLGGVISGGAGWVLGLLLPAMLIASVVRRWK
jgi:hypothetical protein